MKLKKSSPFSLHFLLIYSFISSFLLIAYVALKAPITTLSEEAGIVLGTTTNRQKQISAIQSNKINEANKLLVDKPAPIAKLQMEGKLSTDPGQIATVKSLNDVKKIFTLGYAYKITNDPRYLSKTQEFLLAWATTYHPSGNAIDESHLQPLFEGYSWVRDGLAISDQQTIDRWLASIAQKESSVIYHDARDNNNWNSHRINIIGQIGYLIGNKEYISYALESFKNQVKVNLYQDGSSFDYIERDALHYHNYDIWPLLNLAKTASLHGVDLYNYQSESRSSLKASVHFIFPYVTGNKTHFEFVNSQVAWDKRSGSKSQSSANAKKWDPKSDLYILELAYFFDDDALPLIQKLRATKSEIPSFEIMLAEEQRLEVPIINSTIQSKF